MSARTYFRLRFRGVVCRRQLQWFSLLLFFLGAAWPTPGWSDDVTCDNSAGKDATVSDASFCDAFRVNRDDDAKVDPRLLSYMYEDLPVKGRLRSFALIVSVSKYNTQPVPKTWTPPGKTRKL